MTIVILTRKHIITQFTIHACFITDRDDPEANDGIPVSANTPIYTAR